jgi:hypothetical protein
MEYQMKVFYFALEHNEDEAGEFEWVAGDSITFKSSCLENAIQCFYEKYKSLLSEVLDWYADDAESDSGMVIFANSTNGRSIHFRVKCS